MFGTLEPDVYFYGEMIEKIGADKYKITKGGVHDLRAADAALGDCQRQLDRQPPRLRAAQQRDHARQGRAGLLPADHVLPDPGRRPGDRLPAADLRPLHVSAASRSATRSSGRSTGARTPRSSTTGSRSRGQGVRQRVSLPPLAAVAGQFPLLPACRERRTRRGGTSNPERTSYSGAGQRHAAAGRRASAGACAHRLLLRHHRPAARTTTTSTSRPSAPDPIGGGVSGAWKGSACRAMTSAPSLLRLQRLVRQRAGARRHRLYSGRRLGRLPSTPR